MNQALLYLLWRQVVGRVVTWVRRLKQPRYLLGLLIGGGWAMFWISRIFFRSGSVSVQAGLPPEALEVLAGPLGNAIHVWASAPIAIGLTLWWLLPFGKRALEFTEPELHVLLPAPVARRHLMQYAILKSQPGVLFGALIFTFFTGPATPAGLVFRLLGVWVVLTLLDLHGKARGLWLSKLATVPRAVAWRRRLIVWGALSAWWFVIVSAIVGVIVGILADRELLALFDDEALLALGQVLENHIEPARHGTLGWALTPILLMTAPVFIGFRDPGFLQVVLAWLFPLVVLVLHNEWVVRSQIQFEEEALQAAKRRSKNVNKSSQFWLRWQRTRRWQPFQLPPQGRPATAILWANLMSVQRLPLWRVVAVALALCAGVVALVVVGLLPSWMGWVLYGAGMVSMVVIPFFGPRSTRNDFRTNLLKAEMLRPWPLTGTQMFLGQIAGPAIVAMAQVVFGAGLVLMVDFAATARLGPFERATFDRLSETLGMPAALAGPVLVLSYLPVALAVSFLTSALENLAALLFPSWVYLGTDKRQAAAKFGQHMIVFLALSLIMLLAIAPAVLLVGGILAIQLLVWDVGLVFWEFPLLGLLAAATIGAVDVALIGAGGALWSRLDPSEEILGGTV